MKKFGTPIGAAPGSDSENVGFDAEGTPLVPLLDFLCDPVLELLCVWEWCRCFRGCVGFWPCEDGRCAVPGPVECGGDVDGPVDVVVDGDVDVVVEVEVEVDVGVEVDVDV